MADTIEISAFDWVPDFAQGYVRDIRVRWACEEAGIPYTVRLLSAREARPADYLSEQPWGQVPAIRDGDVRMFESGAIILYIAARSPKLLPADPVVRGRVTSWVFAASNSVEPMLMELGNVRIFSRDADWARLRAPSLMAYIGDRLDRLSDALGDAQWLAGDFTVADIAMASALRGADGTDLVAGRPRLAAYLERALARPAFARALEAQLAQFRETEAA